MSQDVSPVKCNISRLISCLLLSGLMQIHIEYPKQKKGNKKKPQNMVNLMILCPITEAAAERTFISIDIPSILTVRNKRAQSKQNV